MSAPLVVPVSALMGPPVAAPPRAGVVRVACHAPPRPTPVPVAVSSPASDRLDRMLLERAVSEIERLRMELGASEMATEAARSEAARMRLTAGNGWNHGAERLRRSGGFTSYEPMSRPVPASMRPRESEGVSAAGQGPPGAEGAAPLVRTVIVGAPRSLVSFFV